ncbi:hypothetical protein DFH08DRAFT_319321 [Mycena albidolilacea]|uniref:DUF6534 domain-containing protein n=1 Tax=Mycena albidolilacea TaxID=1033008 RepID=A0AAD6ZLJ5_9AGAR|nr:hypothetical protein DFH08DRAFT_319321 [Mycena albidolilacea]
MPPPSVIEVSLITLLVSSWVNVALYTLELVLCGLYFARSSRPFVHKFGVVGLVFVDGVCTLSICLDVALAALSLPPTGTNLHLIFTPLAAEILTTNVSAGIAQLFLCNLLYNLTGNKALSGSMLLLIFVHIGFSCASAIGSLATLFLNGFVLITTTLGAIFCAATDILIAILLTWKYWTMMADTIPEHSTTSLLRRVLIMSVSSGAICASNTLLMMILLLKQSAGFFFFFNCQGRVYALTILCNFLFGIPARNRTETTPTRFSNFHSRGQIDIPDTVMTRNENSPPDRLASRIYPSYAPMVLTSTRHTT